MGILKSAHQNFPQPKFIQIECFLQLTVPKDIWGNKEGNVNGL